MVRPVAAHTPSFCSTCAAGVGTRLTVGALRCWMGTGDAMIGTYHEGNVYAPSALPFVPAISILSGRPPSGGGLFVYHHRSMVLTMPFPPLSRIHSTVRIESESLPGARSAFT